MYYRWLGNYAQEFEGPNDTFPTAGPGDFVDLEISDTTPLAKEYLEAGLLLETPDYTPPKEAEAEAETTTKSAKGGSK